MPKAAVAIFNICTIVGFGTVIKSTPAFELLVDAVIHIPGNYLVGVSVGTALLAGFCGSASGGLGIITPIFYDIFGAMQGVSYAAIARVMAIASSSLDSLPHSGSVNTSIGLCGESHKSAYIPIFCLSVVTPAICTAVQLFCLRCFQGGRKIFINCLERSQSFLNINVTQSAILVENKRNGLDKE